VKSSRRIRTVCILVPLLVIAGFATAYGENPADAVVVYTRGDAKVKFNEAADFVRLVGRTRLGAGDVLETGDKTKVELELSDESMIVIGENSRVVIKELNTVEVTRISRSAFELLKGRIRAIVNPFAGNDSRFTIETSNATVGVRGTDFGVAYIPSEEVTHLLTVEGTVSLTLTRLPQAPPISVIGGYEITVSGDRQPPGPSKAPGGAIYRFLQDMMVVPDRGWNHNEGGGQPHERDRGPSLKH
jgi:ferric-dicitrate binding protein FerR (iron transport regulator)